LRVSAAAVDLVLTPLPGGRVASDLAPVTHPAGHTWLWLLVWPAGAAAFPEMALVAGVVLAMHLALDYGSHAILAPLWPLSARTTGGLRTWNGARQATALGLGGLALLALIVELLTDAQTRWIAAHPMRALLLGATLSGLALAGARRLRRDRPA
jgi:hypothetical protein